MMSSRLIIQNVTGSEPYQVYVCNFYETICEYLGILSGVTLGKVFYLSSTFDMAPIITVKLIDNNGCQIKKNILCDSSCVFQVILYSELESACTFDAIIQENGDFLLQENDFKILI